MNNVLIVGQYQLIQTRHEFPVGQEVYQKIANACFLFSNSQFLADKTAKVASRARKVTGALRGAEDAIFDDITYRGTFSLPR